jgi:hypothetical protein
MRATRRATTEERGSAKPGRCGGRLEALGTELQSALAGSTDGGSSGQVVSLSVRRKSERRSEDPDVYIDESLLRQFGGTFGSWDLRRKGEV